MKPSPKAPDRSIEKVVSVQKSRLASEDRALLESVASASVGPREAFLLLRALLDRGSGETILERVYEALRSAVYQFVAGHERSREIDLWADVILRTKQLFRMRSDRLAERLTVLADFMEQASRFAAFNPATEMRSRKHVSAILRVLAHSDKPVERARLIEATGLGQANLSRILGNLIALGWVSRGREGREVLLTITPSGRTSGLKEDKGAQRDGGFFAKPETQAILSKGWAGAGAAIAVSEEGTGIVDCDAGFARLFGADDPSPILGRSVAEIRSRIAGMPRAPDEVAPDEVILTDGRTLRVVEHRSGDSSVWLGVDVSPYRERIETYVRREKILTHEITELRASQKSSRRPSVPAIIHNERGESEDLYGLLAAIRQDLLVPATSISNAAGALRSVWISHSSDADQSDQLTSIITASDKLRSLLRDILQVAEIGRPGSLAISEFRPEDVLRDVVEKLSYSARHQRQPIEISDLYAGKLDSDELLFRTASLNAVVGVMGFADPGSPIGLRSELTGDCIKIVVHGSSVRRHVLDSSIYAGPFRFCREAAHSVGGSFDVKTSKNSIVASCLLPILSGFSNWK